MLPLLLLAAVSGPTSHADLPCVSYVQFQAVLDSVGAQQTQTIELPSFPDIDRMIIVTVAGTKEVFMARDTCVLVPAIWVDYDPSMKVVPAINWNFADGA